MNLARLFPALAWWAISTAAIAQTQTAVKPAQRAVGEVTSIDAQAHKIVIKNDEGGGALTIVLNEKTRYFQVPPGEKDLTKATRIAITDIGVGDRLLAR